MATTGWFGRLRTFDALALTSAIWFLAKFVRYAFPPLFETFQAQYGVSNAVLGGLFTLLMTVYAAMQFPSGALADRLGTVRVIVGGVSILAGATMVLFATQAFLALAAVMALIGLGTGAHKTVAINLLSAMYPARTGRVLGTMDAVGELAGVAAPAAVLAVLATPTGWPGLFLAVGLVGVCLAGAFAWRVPRRLDGGRLEHGSAAGEDDPGAAEYLAVVRTPGVAGFLVVVVAYAFAFNGLVAFLPLFLTSANGLPAAQAGALYSSLFVVSLVQPVTGALSDRIGRRPVMVVSLALAGGALGLLVAGGAAFPAAVLVPLLGIGGHGFRPVRDSHLMDLLPAEAAGGTLGAIRTVMMGVGAVSPAVVGVLSEVADFAVAFGALAGAFGIGAVTVALLALRG